jgi:hypothetical protein
MMSTAGVSAAGPQELMAQNEAMMAEAKRCGQPQEKPKSPTGGGFVDGSVAQQQVRQAGLRASGSPTGSTRCCASAWRRT